MRSSSSSNVPPVVNSLDSSQILQSIEMLLDNLEITQPVNSSEPQVEVNINVDSSHQGNNVTERNISDEKIEDESISDIPFFDLIPQEIALRIFNLLNPTLSDLISWQLVSWPFYVLSKDNTIWKKRFNLNFVEEEAIDAKFKGDPNVQQIQAIYASALAPNENDIHSNENELWYTAFRKAVVIYNQTFTRESRLRIASFLRLRFTQKEDMTKYANFFAWAKNNAVTKFESGVSDAPGGMLKYQDLSVTDIYGMTLKDWALRNGSHDVLKFLFRIVKDNSSSLAEKLIYAILAKEPARVVSELIGTGTFFTNEAKNYITRNPDIMITAFQHGTSETIELIASILLKNRQSVIDIGNASGLLAFAIENDRRDVALNLLQLILNFNNYIETEARISGVVVDESKKVSLKDAFLQAILQSDRDMVERLSQHMSPEMQWHGKAYNCLAKSNLDMVKFAYQQNPRIIQHPKFLKNIIKNDRKDIIDFCVRSGMSRLSLLSLAITEHHPRAEEFLYADINLHAVNEDNLSLLRLAIKEGRFSLIPYMLVTDPTILNDQPGIEAWFDLVMTGGIDIDFKLSMLSHFLEIRPGLINEKRNGMTALMTACYYNSYQVSNFLIEKGADVNLENNEDLRTPKTALSYAANPFIIHLNNNHANENLLADSGPTGIIELLMLNGADMQRRFTNGKTILHLLANNIHFTNIHVIDKIVELYPEMLDSVDSDGNTPLAISMTNQNNFILAYEFSKLGANANAKLHTPDGVATDLLYIAAARYDSEVIKLLIANGASRKEAIHTCDERLTGRRRIDAIGLINQQKLVVKDNLVLQVQRKTAKARKNTALILQDVKNDQYTQHVSRWKKFCKKVPAQTASISAITRLSSVIGHPSLFYKNHFNKDEKKIIKSFPKLEKIYNRMR